VDGSVRHGLDADDIDDLFMSLLRRLAQNDRTVSDKPSPSYAPTVFEREPECQRMKVTKKYLETSMARLFATHKIRVEQFGPPSKLRSKIVITTSHQPTQPTQPSNTTTATPKSAFHIIGPSDDQCEHCFGIDPDRDGQKVYLIRDPFRGVASHALHEGCADDFYQRANSNDGEER
jgi:hypothetical protein